MIASQVWWYLKMRNKGHKTSVIPVINISINFSKDLSIVSVILYWSFTHLYWKSIETFFTIYHNVYGNVAITIYYILTDVENELFFQLQDIRLLL